MEDLFIISFQFNSHSSQAQGSARAVPRYPWPIWVPLGTRYRENLRNWVPKGTGYRPEKNFVYRWGPGKSSLMPTPGQAYVLKLPELYKRFLP